MFFLVVLVGAGREWQARSAFTGTKSRSEERIEAKRKSCNGGRIKTQTPRNSQLVTRNSQPIKNIKH